MTNDDRLPADLLKRKAVVYVRQSSQTQLQLNLESRRRPYDLVQEAKRHGFRDVEVIDDDQGRSASGTVARPGFDRLVAFCVQAMSAQCFAWTPHALPAMDATDFICSSSVVSFKRG